MDAIDRKILAVVQQTPRSVAEIGQRVGLSSTPCWNACSGWSRQRDHAPGRADRPDKVGPASPCSRRLKPVPWEWPEVRRVVSGMPEVMEFYRMAANVDYMLRVVVPASPATTPSTSG